MFSFLAKRAVSHPLRSLCTGSLSGQQHLLPIGSRQPALSKFFASNCNPLAAAFRVQQQRAASSTTTTSSAGMAAATQQHLKNYQISRKKVMSKIFRRPTKKMRTSFYGGTKKPKFNDAYVAQLLDAYKKDRSYKSAMAIFENILQQKWLRPNVFLYRKFLYCIGYRARRVEEANRIFSHMKQVHSRRDLHSYNIMIHMYAKLHDYQMAVKLFDEMRNEAKLIPNAYTYHYLLKSLIIPQSKIDSATEQQLQEQQERANQIIGTIKEHEPVFLANIHLKKTLELLKITIE